MRETPMRETPTRNVAELIVCERDGRWAMCLQRRLGTNRVRIHQTRSLSECRQAMELAWSSVVVVELTTSNAAEVIDVVADLWRTYAQATVIVVGQRSMANFRPLAIEARSRACAVWCLDQDRKRPSSTNAV